MSDNQFEFHRKIAVKNGWNFNNFKEVVSKSIKRKNDEDQWVFDYQSYCYSLNERNYQHPLEWAKEYYEEDFLIK